MCSSLRRYGSRMSPKLLFLALVAIASVVILFGGKGTLIPAPGKGLSRVSRNVDVEIRALPGPTPCMCSALPKPLETSSVQGMLNASIAPVRDTVPMVQAETIETPPCDRVLSKNITAISLPIPRILSRPPAQVLNERWVKKLQAFLATLPCGSQVNVVCSDSNYREVLLNWLIYSTLKVDVPLTNVLVVSMDRSLHVLMRSRGFPSVLVEPSTVVDPSTEGLREHSAVFLTRLTVLRIINSLGYSVAHYDTDTIILKNPGVLYHEHWRSDVVGSIGWWPYLLSEEPPGFTLCMGVILFRNTPLTERLWEVISKLKLKFGHAQDDQIRLNYAMKRIGVKWNNTNISTVAAIGRGREGFRVTALPTSEVCRRDLTCKAERLSSYYIWHGRGGKSGESKTEAATSSGLWSLGANWREISRASRAEGLAWLQLIAA